MNRRNRITMPPLHTWPGSIYLVYEQPQVHALRILVSGTTGKLPGTIWIQYNTLVRRSVLSRQVRNGCELLTSVQHDKQIASGQLSTAIERYSKLAKYPTSMMSCTESSRLGIAVFQVASFLWKRLLVHVVCVVPKTKTYGPSRVLYILACCNQGEHIFG